MPLPLVLIGWVGTRTTLTSIKKIVYSPIHPQIDMKNDVSFEGLRK